MRIAIREQLAALVVLAVLCALAVVSIPTWLFVNHFVGKVTTDGLGLTASLKAARVSSEINLIQTSCQAVASRYLVQSAYESFYQGDTSDYNWDLAKKDLESALSAAGFATLFQARFYSRNTSGLAAGLLNITGTGFVPIQLPYAASNGSSVVLGDDSDFGYPPMLYPNITYNDTGRPNSIENSTNVFIASAFPGVLLTNNGGLLLGPLVVNSSFALISLTVPVRKDSGFLLGYMTIVASAATLIDIQNSPEGLGNSGVVLIIGPNTPWNRFNVSRPASNSTYVPPDRDAFGDLEMHFVLPPSPAGDGTDRHNKHDYGSGGYTQTFHMDMYPAVFDVFSNQVNTVNNATATLSTTNEQGNKVAVGYARPQSTLVSWAIVVEHSHSEAYHPIVTLRQILLGCVFGTVGLILLIVMPFAHLSVKPIRELKYATEKSIAPPGYEDDLPSSATRSSRSWLSDKSWVIRLRRLVGLTPQRPRPKPRADGGEDGGGGAGGSPAPRVFKIPGRVPEHRHLVTDELTELTTTFNAMSDELFKQYASLDEKVADRTRELEISKKAAEAANESKTLFIANISHELKTPLNGIMGMCAVCMEEDNIVRIKQSLKTLYKSGDLLLHLLEDLLSFSKNQIGHQISLEEREFRLGDIRSQLLSIFDKQVREGRIAFTVSFVGTEAAPAAAPAPASASAPALIEAAPSSDSTRDANGTAPGPAGAPPEPGSGPTNGAPQRSSLDPQERHEQKPPALGPPGMGRLKDMCLWGDQQRILQVMINLVNNGLKFTPANGSVDLRIRCLGEAVAAVDNSRASSFSKAGGSHRGGRSRPRLPSVTPSANAKGGSNSEAAGPNGGTTASSAATTATAVAVPLYKGTSAGTALAINPLDPKAVAVTQQIGLYERSATPPPPGAKPLVFEFEVQDTGPGIAPQMQEKVFEPFVQGDLGLSKKFGGTGLGLSICQQLATLMGGTIKLTSTVGKGSTFTMQIPLKFVRERASSTASSSRKSRPTSVASVDLGVAPAADGGRTAQPSQPVAAQQDGLEEPQAEAQAQPQPQPQAQPQSQSQPQPQSQPQSQPQPQPQPAQAQPGAIDKQARLIGLRQPFFVANPRPAAAAVEVQMAAINRAAANKAEGQGRVRVLVADDNSTNVEVVSRMLKLEDIYDVTIAKDGQEAYDLVKANMDKGQRFDVIFMDIQMPNLDGLQSTRLIRQMGYSAPIVALTAFSEEGNVKECMESGMDEFLSKPIRRRALKQVLQKFATIPEEPETPPPQAKQPPGAEAGAAAAAAATAATAVKVNGKSSNAGPGVDPAPAQKNAAKPAAVCNNGHAADGGSPTAPGAS